MTGLELRQKIEEKGVTLNWLSSQLEVSYTGLNRVAKKPIPGKPYNPEELNYDEIVKFCERNKLKLDEVNFDDYEPRKSTKQLVMIQAGDEFKIKDEIWYVVCVTETHVCLRNGEKLNSMSKTRLASQYINE